MTLVEYAQRFVGRMYGKSRAHNDPATAQVRGQLCRLIKVTPKGVKFDDGKFLPFGRFVETARFVRDANDREEG